MSVTTENLTVRERQQTTVAVLASLLEQDLPEASWDVHAVYPDLLTGQIGTHRGDAETRRAWLRRWAEAVGGAVSVDYHGDNGDAELRVVGRHHGTRVRVWSAINAEDLAEDEARIVAEQRAEVKRAQERAIRRSSPVSVSAEQAGGDQ